MYLSLAGSQPSTLLFLQQDSMFRSFQGKVDYEWQEGMSWFCCDRLSSIVSLLQKAISFLILIWCNSTYFNEL